ncbi:MAG: enoyl-CoA hydratase-related protein [Rhodothalassiaceae bacterium]
MNDILLTEIDRRGVARVTMNRPAQRNAFNDALIAALADSFERLGKHPDVRVVILCGAGPTFSAGADLAWMKAAAGYGEQENHADALRLSGMLHRLDRCPKPTLALVQGAALGGGAGLVACADIVIAVRDARFGFTEVRLGLIPATISPYVLAKIGVAAARRYFLTGERFTAEAAQAIGLVHQTVGSAEDLESAGEQLVEALLAGAPGAQAAAKALIADIAGRPVDAALREETAARIAARRAAAEAREGMAAFFARRKPDWIRE